MNSRQLSVVEFGDILLRTEDLDPIYCILHGADLEQEQLKRWLLAYFIFYDLRTASLLSEFEGDKFYNVALDNIKEIPRGTERRHYRGAAAVNSIYELRTKYPKPELFLDKMSEFNTYKDVKKFVLSHRGFGDWIAFKIGDMVERLGLQQVTFDVDDVELYSEPQKGAQLVDPIGGVRGAVAILARAFIQRQAPPRYERRVNIQEFETILCKYKSFWGGHYEPGKDTKEYAAKLKSPGVWGSDTLAKLKDNWQK